MNAAPVLAALSFIYRSKPVRTFAQVLAALIGVAVSAGEGVDAINWTNVLSVSTLAAMLALLQAVADGSSLTSDAVRPPLPDPEPHPGDEDEDEDEGNA